MAATNPEPLELHDEDSLFWQDFSRDTERPAFRRRYRLDAARVAQLDETLALLEAVREEAGVSKADLARHIQTNAVSVPALSWELDVRRIEEPLARCADTIPAAHRSLACRCLGPDTAAELRLANAFEEMLVRQHWQRLVMHSARHEGIRSAAYRCRVLSRPQRLSATMCRSADPPAETTSARRPPAGVTDRREAVRR